MSFKLNVKKHNILYVVEFYLEDLSLVKIGVTSRNIEDRIAEIAISVFHQYRIFPYAYPKRFRKVDDAYGKEKTLHEYFADKQYKTQHFFSGCTEFFDIPLLEVVDAYDNITNGKPLVPREAEDAPEPESRQVEVPFFK